MPKLPNSVLDQYARVLEAARALGCHEDEAAFDKTKGRRAAQAKAVAANAMRNPLLDPDGHRRKLECEL